MTTNETSERYARLLAVCLENTSDRTEAFAAADLAFALDQEIDGQFSEIPFDPAKHPRDAWGRFVETVHSYISQNPGHTTEMIAKGLNAQHPNVQKAVTRLFNAKKIGPVAQTQQQPASGPVQFTTEQGSVYHFNEGKTKRFKTKHVGHLPGDEGEKQESARTLFIDPEHARRIGMWGTSSAHGKRIIVGPSSLMLVSTNPATGKLGRDEIEVPFTTQPKKGLSPLELWDPNDKGWFRANHPGNKITDIKMSLDVDGQFAHDIFDRKAQGILNKALKLALKLSAQTKRELLAAIEGKEPSEVATLIVAFINQYRVKLANLLSATQLAALLQGAMEIAIPPVPIFPHVPIPPGMEPAIAVSVLTELNNLEPEEREERIIQRPANEQTFLRQSLEAARHEPPPVEFTSHAVAEGGEELRFPIIDEAVNSLSRKNVMTRAEFDALDAATRGKAFTVTGIEAKISLEKIRDSLAESTPEADLEDFKKTIRETVSEGTILSEPRLENIFRTAIQSALSDGKMAVLNHPFVKSGFPFYSYNALDDDRVRKDHLALEKLGIQQTNIYLLDDPVAIRFRPPWDYQCRCNFTPITIRQAAEAGIEHAKAWLESGVEPSPRPFVPMPSFRPPPGFERSLGAEPLIANLSLEYFMNTIDATLAITNSEMTTKLANGRTVSFIPHPNQRHDETTMMVHTHKLDKAFSNHQNYIGTEYKEGSGEVKGRREAFHRFLESGKPVEASRMSMDKDTADFEDGRHRFAVLRDSGASHVAVTVPKHQSDHIRQHLGGDDASMSIDAMLSAKESGHWITIGGKEGKDGKKHGGSPVFIEGGRITKGHPSLEGKKIDALPETSHRKQLADSKQTERVEWGKKARKHGFDSASLHQLAAEHLEHDKAFKGDVSKAIKHARKTAQHYGEKLGGKAFKDSLAKGTFDAASVPHFDEIADSVHQEYPHLFPSNVSKDEHLAELMQMGEPERMSEDQAYREAFDYLRHHAKDKRTEDYFQAGTEQSTLYAHGATEGGGWIKEHTPPPKAKPLYKSNDLSDVPFSLDHQLSTATQLPEGSIDALLAAEPYDGADPVYRHGNTQKFYSVDKDFEGKHKRRPDGKFARPHEEGKKGETEKSKPEERKRADFIKPGARSELLKRAEALARHFHETYERLAPDYGYKTRKDSAVPWKDVPEKNKNLMIAVAAEILKTDLN